MNEPAAEFVPIEALTPWAQNPRTNDHAVESIADSIARFGFGAPIVARRQDSRVIAGHTRLKAAQRLGLEQVPVRFLDLSEAEASALALADNKLGELAEWDGEQLEAALAELEADGVDLEGLGWTGLELEDMLAPEAPELEMGEEELSEPPNNPESRAGEVYELGPHRLVCGDCRDPAVVARLMDGETVHLAFTSPPYASQRAYDESSGFEQVPPDRFVDWFEAVQANVKEHLTPAGSWFVNIKEHCQDGQRVLYVKDLTIAHVRRWGWRFVDEFCWQRNTVPGKWANRYKNGWEPVFHFALGKEIQFFPEATAKASSQAISYSPAHHFGNTKKGYQEVDGRTKKVSEHEGMAYVSNVVTCSKDFAGTGHSAPFPLALPSFFIKSFTKPNGVVFDPFLGSGTTLIAAASHERIGYGCEISPGYCDVIRKRWTQYARERNIDPGPGALE